METVKGKHVTVTFDGKRCVHSRNCVLTRPDVFVPNVQGDWIFPDRADPEDVIRLGLNCPSGAIRVAMNEGSRGSDRPPLVNTARVRENGPLAVEADLVIAGSKQNAARATLCRCGLSANKPFCDGSHANHGFTATGEPPAKDSAPLERRDGPIEISPQKNGPLRVTGNLEIVTGTGHTVNRVTSVYLCRCGHSASKPYCDGSHNRVGFLAGD